MKRLLQFSVALNIALVAFAVLRSPRSAPSRAPVPRALRTLANSSAVTSRNPARHSAAWLVPTPWQRIESADLATFMANLRAVGCPERTIRDIVVFRVCRDYFQRALQMEHDRAHQAGLRGQTPAEWREGVYATRELRNQMITTLESALGVPWEQICFSELGWPERGFDVTEGMSLDQRRLVRDIKARYDRQEGDLAWRILTGDISLEEEAQLRQWHRDQRDELAKILSPQQLEEYLYRDSPAANYVRRNLPPSGSEQEYRAAVQLAQELEIFPVGNSNPNLSSLRNKDVGAEMKRREAEFNQRLRDLIGDDRMAERQAQEQAAAEAERQRQQTESDAQMQARLSQNLIGAGATQEQAERFIARAKELEPELNAKFDALKKSQTGTPEENQKALQAAMKAEMEKIATQTMGNDGPVILNRAVRP